MIFPIIRGILSFKRAPVTWSLFLINTIVLIVSLFPSQQLDAEFEGLLKDELFLTIQGRVFAQYIHDKDLMYNETLKKLAEKVNENADLENAKILGSLALRDTSFQENGEIFIYDGDQVAFEWWKDKVQKMNYQKQIHPSYMLGINSESFGWNSWITYQFAHSGFVHFFGNMFFLLIFGSALEPLVGGVFFLLFYLSAGMVGAGTFLVFSGITPLPLVGASGAVSGIMALFGVLFWKRPVKYMYFLFIPKRDYLGFIYLPAWVAFGMWFVSDLAGYLSSMREMGGIAYSAHLGGEFAGFLAGLVLVFLFKWRTHKLDKIALPETRPTGTMLN